MERAAKVGMAVLVLMVSLLLGGGGAIAAEPSSTDKSDTSKVIEEHNVPTPSAEINELQSPPPSGGNKSQPSKKHYYIRDPGMFWVSVATLIIVAIYAWYARKQAIETGKAANAAKKSAEVAEKTILATQRPWISVQWQIESGLKFDPNLKSDPNKGIIPIKFILKNVGNSPAVGTKFKVGLFLSTPKRKNIDEQRKICDEGPDLRTFAGFLLFPGQEMTYGTNVAIRQEDIDQSNSEWYEVQPDLYYKLEDFDIHIVIAGCVKYAFTFDGSPHKTTFMIDFTPTSQTAVQELNPYTSYVGSYAD